MVALRGSSAHNLAESTVIVPAATVEGDMIVLIGNGYGVPGGGTNPESAGYGLLLQWNTAPAGTFGNNIKIWYKFAGASDAGSTVTVDGASWNWGSILCMVFSNTNGFLDKDNLVNWGVSGATTAISTGTISPPFEVNRLVLISQMASTATVPTLTVPSGFTQILNNPGSGGYWRALTAWRSTQEPAGSYPAVTATSDATGATIGLQIPIDASPILEPPVVTLNTLHGIGPLDDIQSAGTMDANGIVTVGGTFV